MIVTIYNGNEIQTNLANQFDYVVKFYPVIGRWNLPDPLAEKYSSISPYIYALNNPIYYVDPKGEELIPAAAKGWGSSVAAIRTIYLTETGGSG